MRAGHSNFLLFLLLALMFQQLFRFVPDSLYGVNKTKTFPKLTLQSWWSGEFQSGFEEWQRENLGFRAIFIRIRNQKDYTFFGKVHANDVVIGKDGYLFQESYLVAWSGMDFLGENRIAEMATKLLEIQDSLKKKGKTFVVGLAPGKGSFFPEYVPPKYAAARQPRNNGEEMAFRFQDIGVNVIDYNHDYMASKKTSPYPLIGKTGIHWSNYGAVQSLQRFISRVEQDRGVDLPGIDFRNVRLSSFLRPPDGDLGELYNLIIPPAHWPMATFELEWESPEGRETPKLAVFSDSFFIQWVHFGITPNCFRETEYFLYNDKVWSSSTSSPKNIKWDQPSKEAALKAIDDADVILILATESNYSGLGFGYLDALHEHLKADGS